MLLLVKEMFCSCNNSQNYKEKKVLKNKKIRYVVLLVFLILTLVSCSSTPIKYTTYEGSFSKLKAETIAVDIETKSSQGFYSSLDFNLTEGQVDWEILSPENELVFKGYVVYKDGKVYRELTYPLNYLSGTLNLKEEVKDEIDKNGNIIHIPDFNYLQFEVGSQSGVYKLNLQPINADGSYEVTWSNKLPSK